MGQGARSKYVQIVIKLLTPKSRQLSYKNTEFATKNRLSYRPDGFASPALCCGSLARAFPSPDPRRCPSPSPGAASRPRKPPGRVGRAAPPHPAPSRISSCPQAAPPPTGPAQPPAAASKSLLWCLRNTCAPGAIPATLSAGSAGSLPEPDCASIAAAHWPARWRLGLLCRPSALTSHKKYYVN